MPNRFRVLALIAITSLIFSCAESPTTPGVAKNMPADAAGTSKVNLKKCSILMGWDPWEPYQYLDVDGRMRGLDVELARLILGESGCTLRFEEGRWGTLVRKLQEGDIDMLMAASRTPSRESFAYFSDPYRGERFKLYVRKGEASKFPFTDIKNLLDARARVGVTEQYVYGDIITDLQSDPKYADLFVGATIGALNQQRLLDMKIEGFLEDPFVMAQALRNKGLSNMIEAHPLEVYSGQVSMMFSQASVAREVVDKINETISNVKEDGRHQDIIDKYLR